MSAAMGSKRACAGQCRYCTPGETARLIEVPRGGRTRIHTAVGGTVVVIRGEAEYIGGGLPVPMTWMEAVWLPASRVDHELETGKSGALALFLPAPVRGISFCDGSHPEELIGLNHTEYSWKIFAVRPRQCLLQLPEELEELVRRLVADLRTGEEPCPQLLRIRTEEFYCRLRHAVSDCRLANFACLDSSDADFEAQARAIGWRCRTSEDFARTMGMPRNQFRAKFRRVFGMEPVKWSAEQRKEAIVRELCGDKSIKRISMEYEFQGAQQLAVYTLRHFGVSPREMRSHLRAGRPIEELTPERMQLQAESMPGSE